MSLLFLSSIILLLLLLLTPSMLCFNRLSFINSKLCLNTRSLTLNTWTLSSSTKDLPIRPSLDDVEKISYGQAAKKRGIGSRGVPHRLNAEERSEWDLAKKRG